MLFIKHTLVHMKSWTADTEIQPPHLCNGSKTSVIGNNWCGGRSTELKFQTFSIKRPEWRCWTSPRPLRLNTGTSDCRLRLQCVLWLLDRADGRDPVLSLSPSSMSQRAHKEHSEKGETAHNNWANSPISNSKFSQLEACCWWKLQH